MDVPVTAFQQEQVGIFGAHGVADEGRARHLRCIADDTQPVFPEFVEEGGVAMYIDRLSESNANLFI